jgi:hypothetical protein
MGSSRLRTASRLQLRLAAPLLASVAFSLHAAEIRGTVVENQTGYPLARATVVVAPLEKGPKGQTAHTNASGIFEFTGLAAGTYRITATKLDFVFVQYGQKRWDSPGMPITLAAGDSASLTIRVPRFGAITGTVLDENDVGLPAQEVVVYTNTQPPKLLARSTTDDRGMYRLWNLQPGSYLIRSVAKVYEDETYLPTFYRDSPTLDQARPIEVKLDEEISHVDFHAAPGRLFTVAGRANNAFGQPVVTLSSDVGTETATIDGEGNFSFRPAAPGTYELLTVVPSDRGRGRSAAYQTLTVDRDLTLRISTGPLPSVEFVFEDKDGHPVTLPEGRLMGRRKDAAGENKWEWLPTKATLLPGRWEVALAPDPSYYVAGFQAPQQESASGQRFDGWNEFLLTSGQQNVVKLVLSQAPGTISGTVKNASGDAVADVPVFIEPYDLDLRKRVEPVRRVKADASGQYQVGGLAPGTYRLLASFDYNLPAPSQMAAAEAKIVKVEEVAHAVLDLEEFVIK